MRVGRFGWISGRGSSGMSPYGQQSIPNNFPMISERYGTVSGPPALSIHSNTIDFPPKSSKNNQIPVCVSYSKLHRDWQDLTGFQKLELAKNSDPLNLFPEALGEICLIEPCLGTLSLTK